MSNTEQPTAPLAEKILRCLHCERDTAMNPCEHCGSTAITDRAKPHRAHWTRHTLTSIRCKICDRIASYEAQLHDNDCAP